jgi:hypothetical protein
VKVASSYVVIEDGLESTEILVVHGATSQLRVLSELCLVWHLSFELTAVLSAASDTLLVEHNGFVVVLILESGVTFFFD